MKNVFVDFRLFFCLMLIYITNTSFHMVTTTAIYDLSILPDLSRFPVGFAYCIYGCPLELLAMTTM